MLKILDFTFLSVKSFVDRCGLLHKTNRMTLIPALMLTDQNHFQHGFIEGHPEVYFAKLGSCSRPSGLGIDEGVFAAKLIHKSAMSQPIKLCLSGGIDSEVMLQCFLQAQVPFTACILRFNNNLNHFDIFNVLEFCEKNNILFEIIDLNVVDFFDSGAYLEFGKKYRCQSPQIATHLWFLDQIKGFPVLSGNFIYPQQTEEGLFYVGLPGDLHSVYFRYFEINHRPAVPWFMLYTPEFVQSFLNTELVQQQLQKTMEDQIVFSYLVKCEIYKQAGFQVEPRADKFTGFEKVKVHYDQQYGENRLTKFDQLFRKPLVEINPLPKEFLQILPSTDI